MRVGRLRVMQVKWPSRYVLRKTALVSVIAAAISISLSTGVRAVLGIEADTVTVLVRLILPFAIAIPIALVGFSKLEETLNAYRDLMRKSSELARRAATDPLTGLLNRRSFIEQFDLTMAHGVGGLFVLADADRLKAINDQYGHLAGDDAIIALGKALESVMGSDCLIARIGGDEFCDFVPNRTATLNDAQLAEINRLATEGFATRSGNDRQPVSATCGSVVLRPPTTFREAIERTDRRLYGEKQARSSSGAVQFA